MTAPPAASAVSSPIVVPLVGPRSLLLRVVRDGARLRAYLEMAEAGHVTGPSVCLPLGRVPALRSALARLEVAASAELGVCGSCGTPLGDRECVRCGARLKAGMRADARYCGDRCRSLAASERYAARRRDSARNRVRS